MRGRFRDFELIAARLVSTTGVLRVAQKNFAEPMHKFPSVVCCAVPCIEYDAQACHGSWQRISSEDAHLAWHIVSPLLQHTHNSLNQQILRA